VAGQAVLDMIGKMQTRSPPPPTNLPSRLPTFTEEGLPDTPYLEKLAHNPAAHVAPLFHCALLSALQTTPGVEIKVCCNDTTRQ